MIFALKETVEEVAHDDLSRTTRAERPASSLRSRLQE